LDLAITSRHNLTANRLFGSGIWYHDPARGSALFFQTFDDDAIVQWANFH
jgi:hypothetical protein